MHKPKRCKELHYRARWNPTCDRWINKRSPPRISVIMAAALIAQGIYSQWSNYASAHRPCRLFAASIVNRSSLSCHTSAARGATEVNGGYYTRVVCMRPQKTSAAIWLRDIRCLPELLWIRLQLGRCGFHKRTYSGISAGWSVHGLG